MSSAARQFKPVPRFSDSCQRLLRPLSGLIDEASLTSAIRGIDFVLLPIVDERTRRVTRQAVAHIVGISGNARLEYFTSTFSRIAVRRTESSSNGSTAFVKYRAGGKRSCVASCAVAKKATEDSIRDVVGADHARAGKNRHHCADRGVRFLHGGAGCDRHCACCT